MSKMVNYLLPEEDLPSLECVARAIELDEEKEMYKSRKIRRLRAGLSTLIRRYWNGLLRGRRHIGVLLGIILFLRSIMKIGGEDQLTVPRRAGFRGQDCPHARPIEVGKRDFCCLVCIYFIQHMEGGVLSDIDLDMHAH
jgi:hypothetical protein